MLIQPAMAAVTGLRPVKVCFAAGDSNTGGAKVAVTDLPSNWLLQGQASGGLPYDPRTFIWDGAQIGGSGKAIRPLTFGPMEQQPGGAAYVDPTFPNCVGWYHEFNRHFRVDNPNDELYFFVSHQGGGRFSDLNSRGRAANYTTTLTDGAYAEMVREWRLFVNALHQRGCYPVIVAAHLSMGGNQLGTTAEVNSLAADLATWEAAMRADMLGPTVKVCLARLGIGQTTNTDLAGVMSQQATYVSGDTARRELMNFNGMRTIPTAGDVHWNAASHVAIGELFYYCAFNLWHPLREVSAMGSSFEPVRMYIPGDLRNLAGATAFTTTGGNVQSAYNCADARDAPCTHATDSKRPIVVTSIVKGGYVARLARADGVDDILTTPMTAGLGNLAAWGTFCSFKGAAQNLKVPFAEGNSSSANPFWEPNKSDASGNMMAQGRNDAGIIFINIVQLQSGAFNNVMNFLSAWGSASSVTGAVNGSAGTAQSITRGTMTDNNFSLFGLLTNGSEAHQMAGDMGAWWDVPATPDATYNAGAQAYMQRRWGTV